MAMTHGSLFSGIGGFDLASEWMGWENKFHCEWNEFGQKVLHHYWPEAELFTDITKSNFTKYANKIDILTGGFPCQPYSSAGKRLGKEDSRHLWPEMLRAIREIQPRWVVGENVRGLTNWNGGLVFDEVQSDLEAEGYEVLPFLLPACAVNAPHRRDRIWFVAYSISASKRANELRSIRPKDGEISGERSQTIHDATGSNGFEGNASDTDSDGQQRSDSQYEINTSEGREYAQCDTKSSNDNGDVTDSLSIRLQQCKDRKEMGGGQREMGGERSKSSNAIKTNGKIRNVTDTKSKRSWQQQQENRGREDRRFDNDGKIQNVTDTNIGRQSSEEYRKEKSGRTTEESISGNWQDFPTVSPICNGDDGLSDRLDNITFPKWRNESIKAGGNAIVPQVVYQIFKAIEQYELNA